MCTTRQHPEGPGETAGAAGHTDRPAPSRWQKVISVAGLAAVLWAGNNLYDTISQGGTGPGGPGGHGPPAGTPTTTVPTQPGSEPPSGGHDPSQFDHG